MEHNIVKVEHLSHRYGRAWAIQDINFEISEHGVLGLLGSNGAGKSTTMNILCGVLNQTQGNVWINGINLRERPEAAKRYLGFLPQNAPLYLDLTVDEYLVHCAYLRQLSKSQVRPAVEEAKERCGVAHFSHRLISNLSGGYKQRVGIAQAILHKPQLVVLDEPTNGLDPNQITEVRALIKEIGTDKAVIFSSHILSEVQATCHYIKMIEDGKMIFSDTMDAFNNYIAPTSLVLTLAAPPALERLAAVEGVTRVEPLEGQGQRLRLHFSSPPTIAEHLVALSVQEGWRLQELTLEKSSADQVFAQLSKKQQPSA